MFARPAGHAGRASGAHRTLRGVHVAIAFALLVATVRAGHAEPPASSALTETTTPTAMAENAAPSEQVQPYAFTISGGVSLGSYEAGVNWAGLEILRTAPALARFGRPDLVGVTGASAGSINALLSALHWCRRDGGRSEAQVRRATTDPDPRGPHDNLFARAWLPVGLDTLIVPRAAYDDSSNHMPDALLSRRAFSATRQVILDDMSKPLFRPGCAMTIGVTVTRIIPGRYAQASLSVANQRFVVPLRLSVDADGRLAIANDLGRHRPDLVGSTLYLADRDDARTRPDRRPLRPETVVDAVMASSAFPVAFGPVRLSYFVREEGRARRRGQAVGFVLRRDWFVDGGVFDNIPLGVAIAQVERPHLFSRTAKPVRYLYIDPGNRRRRSDESQRSAMRMAKKQCAESGAPGPISRAFGCWRYTLAGAVATARDYELHNVLRYNAWNRGSSRVGREVGEKLGAGAVADAGATSRGRERLHACLGRDLDVFAVPLDQTPEVPLSKLTQCLSSSLDAYRPSMQLALGAKLIEWSDALDSLRLAASSARSDHDRIRGAILRISSAIPEIVGREATTAAGVAGDEDDPPLDALAAEAHSLAGDPGSERVLLPSRRLFPLASTYAANFSGFLDLPLRTYDYYVGIHDALHSSASVLCEWKLARGTPTENMLEGQPMQDCIAGEYQAFRRRLAIDGSGELGSFLDLLARFERAYWLRDEPPAVECRRDDLHRILCALALPRGKDGRRTFELEEGDLAEFVRALRDVGYRGKSAAMRAAMRDPDLWWASLSIELLARQRDMEPSGVLAGAMFATERLMAALDRAHDDGLFIQPATIPPNAPWGWNALRVLPQHVATSATSKRTLEAAWQMGAAWSGLRGAVDARFWLGSPEGTPAGPNLDIGLHLGYHSRTLVKHVLVSSFGVAPGYTVAGEARESVRLELYMTTLSDKLRFAVGTNAIGSVDDDPWHATLYGSVGLSDFPGSVYSVLRRVGFLVK